VTAVRGIVWALLAIASLIAPPEDGRLFGEDFTLASGETYAGNLIAVDSRVLLEPGSVFDGNLILIGGSLEAAGSVTGNIAAVGAAAHLAPTVSVDGDVACIGQAPVVDDGARVAGTVNAVEGLFPPAAREPSGTANVRVNLGYEISSVLFRLFLLSAVAILIVLLFPGPAQRVTHTIVEKPAVSFIIGLLTMTAAAALFMLLMLTVCLSPVSLLGSAVLLVAALLGWSALGWEIGRRLFGLLGVKSHPGMMAGAGTAALTLAASGLGYIPFVGLLLIGLLVSFGLGAVILTRFGGQEIQILRTPTIDH